VLIWLLGDDSDRRRSAREPAEATIRALKACPERSEGRRLGEDASPEGLIASFRTSVVAEPAL